jgi:hypothetical protein
MVLVVLIGVVGAAALAAILTALWQMRRRAAARDKPMAAEPGSFIRIIRSEEELHAALVRAVRFERQAAEAHRLRVAHYESILFERLGAASNGSMAAPRRNGQTGAASNGSRAALRRNGQTGAASNGSRAALRRNGQTGAASNGSRAALRRNDHNGHGVLPIDTPADELT